MKIVYFLTILIVALAGGNAGGQNIAQKPQVSWGGSRGHRFMLNAIPYMTQITREAIEAGPSWQLEEPPPLKSAAVVATARKQLKELTDDEANWNVDEISITKVSTLPAKWYYRIDFTKEVPSQSRKTVTLLVDFSGQPGKVWVDSTLIQLWLNMSAEEVLAVVKFCGGVRLESSSRADDPGVSQSSNGGVWSFEGYDAIVAVQFENGKISKMRYWTRKDFPGSGANVGDSGQDIIGASFLTAEKKISVHTTKR